MSLREEEQRKNNCPSRGLGLAAAAIGVGVGAALYYIFSKRPENPDAEGSTSGWACEQPHAFNIYHEECDTSVENQCDTSSTSQESEYATVSETTTTDTSVHDSYQSSFSHSIVSNENDSSIEELDSNIEGVTSNDESSSSEFGSDEWDMTHSSLDIPEQQTWSQQSPLQAMMSALLRSPLVTRVTRGNSTREQERRELLRAQALSEEEHTKFLKAQRFRERSWSLEECSICFEIMLKDQQLTSLPCSHNFHSNCIAPWLAEQQTCPNCRKAAE